ncbi:MAG: YkgJ family cysteine cluster protein [Microcystaceae cyanobacterium]
MTTWQCIKGCGACCNLDPKDRPDLEDYLTPEQLTHYLTLVGEDGWCVNYDQDSRECRIYEERPMFCRALPENFVQMFEINKEDFHEFAIECCQEHIEWIYGEESPELLRYNQAVLEA